MKISMRKYYLFLAVFLLFLTGCANDEVKQVNKFISSIGTVTADSYEKITIARKAYEKLNVFDQEEVRKLSKLQRAEAKYVDILIQQAAEDENQIEKARSAYEKMPMDSRDYLESYSLLLECEAKNVEKKIEESLQDFSKVTAAERSYGLLCPEAKQLVTNLPMLETAKAGKVDALILEACNDFSLIENAETAYAALSEDTRGLVMNFPLLDDAKANKVVQEIKDVIKESNSGKSTYSELQRKISEIYNHYDALDEERKKTVSNYEKLGNLEVSLAVTECKECFRNMEFSAGKSILSKYASKMSNSEHINCLIVYGKYLCLQEAQDEIKQDMYNPLSYKLVSAKFTYGADVRETDKYYEYPNEYEVSIKIVFSGTNRLGGTVQQESDTIWYFRYDTKLNTIDKIQSLMEKLLKFI